MSIIKSFAINTRVKEGLPQQSTRVTVDFEGATLEQLADAHCRGQSFRVWLQSRLREDGIPKECSLKFLDYITNAKRTRGPVTFAEMQSAVTTFSREQIAELQAKLDAMQVQ